MTCRRPFAVLASLALLLAPGGCGEEGPAPADGTASVEQVVSFFRSQGKRVATFVGYSGAAHEAFAGP